MKGDTSWLEDGNQSNWTNTSCQTYESGQYTPVAIVAASTGTVSVLACLAVIAVIVVFKKYNFFIQRLILYLCIAATLNSLSVMLRFSRLAPETPDWHTLCVVTAFVDQTTLWSLNLAFCCLTFNMLIVVIFNKSTKAVEMGYICFIFIFPIMFNWIPFLQNSYGQSGAWCWIRTKNYDEHCTDHMLGMYLKYALWYVPHYLLLVILLVAYVIIIINVIRKSYNWRGLYSTEPAVLVEQQKMKELVLPIIFYPLGFFILNLVPLVNRVYEGIAGPNYMLWMMHAALSPLQGGYIALVYVLDKDTMRRLNLKELRAYLFHRETLVKDYPATGGFTDSFEPNVISPNASWSSTDDVKLTLNDKRGYGSMDSSKVVSEKV